MTGFILGLLLTLFEVSLFGAWVWSSVRTGRLAGVSELFEFSGGKAVTRRERPIFFWLIVSVWVLFCLGGIAAISVALFVS